MVYQKPLIIVDFNSHATKAGNKESHLHKVKPIPDSQGNRAERRAYKRQKRKGLK